MNGQRVGLKMAHRNETVIVEENDEVVGGDLGLILIDHYHRKNLKQFVKLLGMSNLFFPFLLINP